MSNTSCNFIWSRGGWSIFLALLLMAVFAVTAKAQYVSTVVSSNLLDPYGVATDPNGALYITDSAHERIMKYVTTSGTLTTLAGISNVVGNNGTSTVIGANAKFNNPQGIVYARGGLVVVDSWNQLIRFVDLNGNVSYIAGVPSQNGGYDNGPGTNAQFNYPEGITADANGNLYVADTRNNAIRMIDTSGSNVVSTVAPGYSFKQPWSLTFDNNSNLWVADTGHNVIVMISNGVAQVMAGISGQSGYTDSIYASNALFNLPNGLVWSAADNSLLISDYNNEVIRRYYFNATPGINGYSVQTIAGTGVTGEVDGNLSTAEFNGPGAMCVDAADQAFYVADSGGNTVRRVQAFPPQPAVDPPQIGYVTFNITPNGPESQFNAAGTALLTFNNPQIIAIKAEGGTQTFMTVGTIPTSPFNDTVPTPTSANGASPSIYAGDGLPPSQTLPSILSLNPSYFGKVEIKAISQSAGRPSSVVVTNQFEFIVANPSIVGNNPGSLQITDLTSNSLIYYSLDGSTPTNDGTYGNGIASGTILSLSVTNTVVLTARAFAPNFLPSGNVTVQLSPTNYAAVGLTFTPNTGYFPECVTITVSNSAPFAFYTTDGSTPSTNSTPIVLTHEGSAFVGFIEWCNPLHDLSGLQMVSFDGNNVGPVVTGSAPPTSEVGFVKTQYAGQGATVLLPVVISLSSNQVLQSIQFIASVVPLTNSAANLSVQNLSAWPITSNDFVQLVGPAPGNAPVNYLTTTNSVHTNGVEMSVLTTQGSGFSVQNFCVATLLKFTVPANAPIGQAYQLSVIAPSGTSDGLDSFVPLVPFASQMLIVADLPYMVGDTVSTNGVNGYDAGEFGDGQLLNADVNSIIYASVGIRTPPPFTDAYNAMDADPPDFPGFVGGDGLINFFDWNLVYNRSLGLPGYTNNWTRQWSPTGLTDTEVSWTNGGPAVPLSLRKTGDVTKDSLAITNPPGLVWLCQASIGSETVVNVSQGSQCSMPVNVNVFPGDSLTGMQFRAVVSANGNAPMPSGVGFIPASGIPKGISLPGLSSNDTVYAWALGAFSPALTGSNLLGNVTFKVPSTAQAGQSYTLRFIGVEGGLNATPPHYQMESFPAFAVIGSATVPVPSITSDEWKIAFFGSVTNPLAADNADPDGDGVPNWVEYLAGTNPTNAFSRLQFGGAVPATNPGGGVTLNWLTAPEKSYILESKTTLAGGTWSPVSTNVGDGNIYQFTQTNHSGNARFYRIRVKP